MFRKQDLKVDMTDKPFELVILNQYYIPDVASTGHLLSELANESSQRGVSVRVITSFPSYGPPESWKPCQANEVGKNISIRRLRTTRFTKDRIFGRIVNSMTFILPLFLRQLFSPLGRKVHLYTTNPPFLAIIGAVVSLIRRHHYVVLLHDSYPQIAVWSGKVKKNGLIEKVWHLVNRLIYKRAQQTIVLCVRAKDLICSTYGVDPNRVHVIHNWADPKIIFPKDKNTSEFAKRHGFNKKFTVLYSGNLGLYYEFESLLNAAEKLQSDPDFGLVFIGAGGKKNWLDEQIKKRNLKNTYLFPYQPFETLNDSLNSCDASLVTIAKDIEGISFPSKLYSSLAVGKPIIAISEPGSELQTMLEDSGAGIWVPLGDVEALVTAILRIRDDVPLQQKMSLAAREAMEINYTIQAATDKYLQVLRLAIKG